MALEAFDGATPEVASDAFVHPAATLIGRVSVGAEASVWPHATLRGDDGAIVIGAQTSIQDGVVIHATEDLSATTIGERVTVGHNAIIHGAIVEDRCLVGMGAILLDNCRIGAGSLVGAGALVTANTVIPPGSLVLGSPAKVIRPINAKEREWLDYSWQHYVKRGGQYRAQLAQKAAGGSKPG